MALTDEATEIYQELKAEGYKDRINKKNYASIIGVSVAAVNNCISKKTGVPEFIKMGDTAQSRVMFRLKDVALFLAGSKVRTV